MREHHAVRQDDALTLRRQSLRERGVRRRRPHSSAYATAKAYWNTWLPNWPSWSKQATYSSAVGAAFLFAAQAIRERRIAHYLRTTSVSRLGAVLAN